MGKIVIKAYRCDACEVISFQATNHTEEFFAHCSNCSWKGIGFAEGYYIGGGPPKRRMKFHGFEIEEGTDGT